MKKRLVIEGMSCQHCVNRVKKALEEVNGVISAEVNLKGKYAVVELKEKIEDNVLKNAIEDAGYDLAEIVEEP